MYETFKYVCKKSEREWQFMSVQMQTREQGLCPMRNSASNFGTNCYREGYLQCNLNTNFTQARYRIMAQ